MCIRLRPARGHDVTAQAESAILAGLRNSDLSIAEVARFTGQAGQQLFQVIGAVQDSPSAELRLEGCAVDPVELPYVHLTVPLLVELLAGDAIASTVRVTYDSALVAGSVARNVSAGLVGRLTKEQEG
jgi:hypothetical protein